MVPSRKDLYTGRALADELREYVRYSCWGAAPMPTKKIGQIWNNSAGWTVLFCVGKLTQDLLGGETQADNRSVSTYV